jgi:hypothetical protein
MIPMTCKGQSKLASWLLSCVYSLLPGRYPKAGKTFRQVNESFLFTSRNMCFW